MSDSIEKLVTIVIRVRNNAGFLKKCFLHLQDQILPQRWNLEIVVVDNESNDASASIAEKRGAKIVSISKRAFSWGRALNQGIKAAKGDIIIILSADAYPGNNRWLLKMLEPFEDPNIAAVYGRQIPHPDAPVDERVRLEKRFSRVPRRFDKEAKNISPKGSGFPISNANAAIRKSVWSSIKYDEEIEAGEDGLWTYQVMQAGFSIYYQPQGLVYHSHKEQVLRWAWREFEILQKNKSIEGVSLNWIHKIHWVGAFIKRRLKNCVWPDIPFKIRFEGMLRLPLEVAAFLFSAVLSDRRLFGTDCRWVFWR